MKRALVFLLTVVALVLALTLTASAEDVIKGGTWGELKWKITNKGELIISGTTEMKDLADDAEGSIDIASQKCWLPYKNKISAITIEEGVTSIGAYAFCGCSKLETITIPDSLTNIGVYAFYDCRELKNITIPNSVTNIGKLAFCYCSALTDVTMPNKITSINMSTFNGCSNLKTIIIPDSVTIIDWQAFKGCSALTSVKIGEGVTSIGAEAFSGCSNLETIAIPDSVISISSQAFRGCSALTSITIGDGVKTIAKSAFEDCTGIIEKENGIYYVDKWVIDSDKSIKSVILRNDTVGIGCSAFLNCSILTSITIPDGVTSIGAEAFYGCYRVESVTIPDSITFLGRGALCFDGGRTETDSPDVYISDVSKWCNIVFGDIYTNPLRCGGNLYLNNELLTELVIPNDVTTINPYAFWGCRNITSITIPDSVISIGTEAFYGCINLRVVFINSESILNNLTSSDACGSLFSYHISTIIIPEGAIVPQYISTSFSKICGVLVNEQKSDIYSTHDHIWISDDCENGLTCSICKLVIDTGEHSYTNYLSDNNATCTEDGTKTAKCDRCDAKDTVTDANTKLGHDFADATCTNPKTCKRSGCTVTDGAALGHTYDNACDGDCNVCNETRTPSNHVWDAGTVTKEPTKKEEGVKTYTCTVCKKTKTESIPMLTGCGGGGAMIALLTNTGIALVWFALKKRH